MVLVTDETKLKKKKKINCIASSIIISQDRVTNLQKAFLRILSCRLFYNKNINCIKKLTLLKWLTVHYFKESILYIKIITQPLLKVYKLFSESKACQLGHLKASRSHI